MNKQVILTTTLTMTKMMFSELKPFDIFVYDGDQNSIEHLYDHCSHRKLNEKAYVSQDTYNIHRWPNEVDLPDDDFEVYLIEQTVKRKEI